MEKIGFIGLGIMGKPMASNLIKTGYNLTVYNRSNEAIEEIVALGASPGNSSKDVAAKSDVIITMLPDSPDVELVVFGDNGIIEGIRPGSLFIDMSTIAPATSKKIFNELMNIGVEALDAPVSGGDIGAKAGTLSIMIGGGETAYNRALPILEVMGKNIVRIGEAGAGQVTKACNQIVVGITIQGVAEALALARNAGVDAAKVRDALLGGFAQSRILDIHGNRIIEENFTPGFKMKLHRKDLNIALQTGNEYSVPLKNTELVAEFMDTLIEKGKAELDHSALALLIDNID